jgi:hypothetical protein
MIAITDSFSSILIINVNPSISIYLSEGSSTFYHKIITRPILINLAHRRLGHISESRVKALALEQAKNLKLLPSSYRPNKYNYYIIGKIKILPYPRKQPILRKAIRLIEILYINLL